MQVLHVDSVVQTLHPAPHDVHEPPLKKYPGLHFVQAVAEAQTLHPAPHDEHAPLIKRFPW